MDLREAQILATQAKGWANILQRVSEGVLAVATAEAEVTDLTGRKKTLADEVLLLKTERDLVKREMAELRTKTAEAAQALMISTQTECDRQRKQTSQDLEPLQLEARTWREKVTQAQADHEKTMATLRHERETVSQQVRDFQETLRRLQSQLAGIA